jgi:protein-disulfide isomerase
MRHLLLVVLMAVAVAGPGSAAPLPTDQALAERSLGRDEAPVLLIEYSSMTCPHCAEFHAGVLAEIKSAAIDTGKVRYVYRDFPLEQRAMAAAMVARCVDPARYFGFVDILFRDQQTWAKSKDVLGELQVRAALAGLSTADFNACLNNRALMDGIQKRAMEGEQQYGIQSTPSFIINGKKFEGPRTAQGFLAAIDAAAAATKKP